MEFLRKLILQTQQHLKGLSASQRLAIGACVGMIALALFGLINWAGQSEMVPLLDQRVAAEEFGRLTQALDAEGSRYEISGDRILVPVNDRVRLQAQLAQRNVLPSDISLTYDKMIESSNVWLSNNEQDRRWSVAKANMLAGVLKHFDGVEEAHVFLDEKMRQGLGQNRIQPTASISIKLAPGIEMTRERVFGFASFVQKAVPGLDISNVGVTDARTGISHSVPKPEDLLAFDDLNDRQQRERHVTAKIRELLSYVAGVRVAVHAELDPRSTRVTKEEHGKPVAIKDRSETEETVEGGVAAEPGVVPNVTPNAPVAAGGSRSEKSVTETTFDGKTDTTLTTSETPRHALLSLQVSVAVPRSFLAGIYRKAHDGKEPTDTELESAPSTTKALTDIERVVKGVLGGQNKEESGVEVVWFPDNVMLADGEVMKAGGADSMVTLVRAYGGKAGLGALALMSLFMMLMMVRRVGEGPVLPGEEPVESPSRRSRRGKRRRGEMEDLFIGNAPVGEAEVTEHLLVGKEVDETTLHTQKIIEQVGELVKEDPGATASILQRWIDAEKQ